MSKIRIPWQASLILLLLALACTGDPDAPGSNESPSAAPAEAPRRERPSRSPQEPLDASSVAARPLLSARLA